MSDSIDTVKQYNFSQLSFLQKAWSSASAVLKHPASWLSTGNALLASYLAKGGEDYLLNIANDVVINLPSEIAAAGPAALSTAIIIGAIAKANVKGRSAKLPFYVHGGLTLGTAYLSSSPMFAEYGSNLIELATSPETAKQFWGNAALWGWGTGHLVTAINGSSPWFNRVSGQSNMALYGAADVSAVYGNPAGASLAALGPAVLGLVRSFVPSKEDVNEYKTLIGKMGWHVTPARLFGTGYLVNGITAVANGETGYGIPNILFGLGVLNFDSEQFGAKQNKVLTDFITNKIGINSPDIKVPSPKP